MGLGHSFKATTKASEPSYEKLKNMSAAQLEEKRHQVAQNMIKKIMQKADLPERKPYLNLRLRRVHIKIGRFVSRRFVGRINALTARILFLLSLCVYKLAQASDPPPRLNGVHTGPLHVLNENMLGTQRARGLAEADLVIC